MADMAEVTTDILLDAFTRVRDGLRSQLDGLAPDQVVWRPAPDANSIGWLAWHLTRVQDDHLADLGDVEQVWTSGGWAERFGLPYETHASGYGQSGEQVGAFSVTDPALLLSYQEATYELTARVLGTLTAPDDYARIVDERWDPPVTAAVRLVSVIGDTTQHLGQLAYVKGLLDQG